MSLNVTDAQLDVNVALSVMITSVTIPANFLLLLIFYKYKNLRDQNNTAITMLSFTDFLRGCVVMTSKIHNQLGRVYELDRYVCHLTAIICAFSFVFCPLILALISFVRYCKIIPRQGKCCQLNDKVFYLLSATLFIIAVLFSILPFLGVGDYDYSASHGVCFADWRNINKVYRTIFYILVIGVAFPVLTISYTMLYLALRKHNKAFVSNHHKYAEEKYEHKRYGSSLHTVATLSITIADEDVYDLGHDKNTTQDNINKQNLIAVPVNCDSSNNSISSTEEKEYSQITEHEEGTQNDKSVAVITKIESPVTHKPLKPNNVKSPYNKSKQTPGFIKNISKQESRVTKSLIFIFIAYVVCWFPAALVNVISLSHTDIPNIWYYIIVSMVELKSALDPVIYGLGNRRYQSALKSMAKQIRDKIREFYPTFCDYTQ